MPRLAYIRSANVSFFRQLILTSEERNEQGIEKQYIIQSFRFVLFILYLLFSFCMYSTTSLTVVIFSAVLSGISIPNSSSMLITSSTISNESADKSSTNVASNVTSYSFEPNSSTIIFFNFSNISFSLILFFSFLIFKFYYILSNFYIHSYLYLHIPMF